MSDKIMHDIAKAFMPKIDRDREIMERVETHLNHARIFYTSIPSLGRVNYEELGEILQSLGEDLKDFVMNNKSGIEILIKLAEESKREKEEDENQ